MYVCTVPFSGNWNSHASMMFGKCTWAQPVALILHPGHPRLCHEWTWRYYRNWKETGAPWWAPVMSNVHYWWQNHWQYMTLTQCHWMHTRTSKIPGVCVVLNVCFSETFVKMSTRKCVLEISHHSFFCITSHHDVECTNKHFSWQSC